MKWMVTYGRVLVIQDADLAQAEPLFCEAARLW